VPLTLSYAVYISKLVLFARIFNNVFDVIERNLFIIDEFLQQDFRNHKLIKTFTIVLNDIEISFPFSKLLAGIIHITFYGNLIHDARKQRHFPGKNIKSYVRGIVMILFSSHYIWFSLMLTLISGL